MRILHFYKNALPDSTGGVEQFIYQLATGTSKVGIETQVLSLNVTGKPRQININDYTVFYVKSNVKIASTDFSIAALRQFKKMVKNADIIHYHFPWPFMDMLHFLAKVDKPTLVTYHSDIIKQKYLVKLYQPLKSAFFKSVDKIVVSSPNMYNNSKALRHDLNKTCIIPFGLDKNTYPIIDNKKFNYWRNQFGEKFFLFVGVIRYYKGLHILLEAAKTIDFPIVIAGDGPQLDDLKKQAQKLRLKNIYFLGVISEEDKVALLTLCYALLFPSHLPSEAFGISLLEGAMFGKPLISTEIGTGTSFVNSHQQTGLVIPPSNSAALAVAMQFLWNNPDKAKVMGENAKQRFETLFTSEKMVSSYVKLYDHLYSSCKLKHDRLFC